MLQCCSVLFHSDINDAVAELCWPLKETPLSYSQSHFSRWSSHLNHTGSCQYVLMEHWIKPDRWCMSDHMTSQMWLPQKVRFVQNLYHHMTFVFGMEWTFYLTNHKYCRNVQDRNYKRPLHCCKLLDFQVALFPSKGGLQYIFCCRQYTLCWLTKVCEITCKTAYSLWHKTLS